MPESFYSWIPTVSGRLSYSHIGESRFPNKCVRFNEIGKSNAGQAVFVQKRYTDDFVLPLPSSWSWVRNRLVSNLSWLFKGKSFSGEHFFVGVVDEVVDKDKSLDTIKGRVYPILGIIDSDGHTGREVAHQIKERINALSRLDHSEATRDLGVVVKHISTDVQDFCPVCVEFSICRNGIVKLTPKLLNVGLAKRISIDEESLRNYAEQAFFFLRDIAHNHQHHEPESDTIIRLHGESQDYRKLIYFDLFRYIIRFKRVKSPENIIRASGILAYASSFKKLFSEDESFPNDYQIDNLKMSLDSAQFELEYYAQRVNNNFSLALTIIFSIFGLLVSLSAMSQFAKESVRKQIVPSNSLIQFTSWVAANPVWFGIGGISFGMAVLLLFGRLKPNRIRVLENSQRLFNHLSKWAFVFPVAILGAALIAIGGWLFISQQL